RRGGPGTIASEDWTTHTAGRRRLQPAFASERLVSLRPVVSEVVRNEIEGWASRGAVDVVETMRRASIHSFARAILGCPLAAGEIADQASRFLVSLDASMQISSAARLAGASLRLRRNARAARASIDSRQWFGQAIER